MIGEHRDAWLARWEASDLRIEGDPAAQRALRFAIYHLLSAANPQDDRVSIGARGLSGTAYKGHVFWDTDIFMLPFFILTYPEAARALVMYRYHTLAAARAKAARLGYRGALYAWESADSGEEATPPFVVAPDGEIIRHPHRRAGATHQCRCGLRRVELLASYRRRSLSCRGGGRNPDRDGALLGKSRRARRRRPLPYSWSDRAR